MKSYSLIASLLIFVAAPALADDYVLTLRDHQFSPKDLVLPANEKVKLTIRNEDSVSTEFESSDLNREKVIQANSEVTLFVGPLNPGTYNYFDDFRRDTTKGTFTVK